MKSHEMEIQKHTNNIIGDMHCVSISHKTAPVHIRQRFAFSGEEKNEFEKRLIDNLKIAGCVIISTCNRSEIYFCGNKNLIFLAENEVAKYKNIDPSEIRKYFLVYSNESAVKHLFKVACGLDSMVLGEDEILRQIKDGYFLSLTNKHTDKELNVTFQNAISCAKSIKTKTMISNTPVSIATLTVNRIMIYLKDRGKSNILVVGASGKTGSVIVRNLCGKKDLNIIATSRNNNIISELFENENCGRINFAAYKDRYDYLKETDVIVSATTSPHCTFTLKETAAGLGGGFYKKLFIDLAVPFDIDKDISSIEGIEILDIDYFEKAAKENNIIKQAELEKAEILLERYTDETLKSIYIQKFLIDKDEVALKIDERGFKDILYHLKKTLNSGQLKALLESLKGMVREIE